jgi:hypothetical protein
MIHITRKRERRILLNQEKNWSGPNEHKHAVRAASGRGAARIVADQRHFSDDATRAGGLDDAAIYNKVDLTFDRIHDVSVVSLAKHRLRFSRCATTAKIITSW